MPKYYFNRLESLDFFLRTRSSGSPTALADKLRVSRRTVFDYLEILRSLGAQIEYDEARQSYYYKKAGRFNFRFIENKY